MLLAWSCVMSFFVCLFCLMMSIKLQMYNSFSCNFLLSIKCCFWSLPDLTEFLSHHSKLNFSAQLNSLILAKCFRAKLWENSPYISRQLERIGQGAHLKVYISSLKKDKWCRSILRQKWINGTYWLKMQCLYVMYVFLYLGSSFLGLTLATAMVNAGLTTFSKIEQKSPRELELVCQNILDNCLEVEKCLFMMKS